MNELSTCEQISAPTNRATLKFRDVQYLIFPNDDDVMVGNDGKRYTGKAGDYFLICDYSTHFVISSQQFDDFFKRLR